MTAELLLNQAYALHYEKRFGDACAAYRALLAEFPAAHECESARRQLTNLRDHDDGVSRAPQRAPRAGERRGEAPPSAAWSAKARDASAQVQNRGHLQGDEGRR